MKLLLKRDETGTSHPSPEQIEVGELVMNSVTGKLYSKLKDGSIVEWTGQRICFEPSPDIITYYNNIVIPNDSIEGYCCLGGIISFEVSKLKVEPEEYTFELVELTNNTHYNDIQVQDAKYTEYTMPKPGSTNITVPVRKAIVPINVSILNSQQTISIFKFIVISKTQNNKILAERIITVKCDTTTV